MTVFLMAQGEPFSRDHLTYVVKGPHRRCEDRQGRWVPSAASHEGHAVPSAAAKTAAEREGLLAALAAEEDDDIEPSS